MSVMTKPAHVKNDGKKPIQKARKGINAKVDKTPAIDPASGVVRSKKSIEEIKREQGGKPQTIDELMAQGRTLRALWESDASFEAFWKGIDDRRRKAVNNEQRTSRHECP